MIVADTIPIVALDFLDLLDLMLHLFSEVTIPTAVDAELRAGLAKQGRDAVLARPWLKRATLTSPVSPGQYGRDVDAGETEALALAVEMKARLLLADDGPARRAARRLGVPVMGTAGILLAGKESGFVSSVGPHLYRLRDEYGFFLGEEALRRILELAGEE
jgi:predicted nucleic acid-binding protein